MWGFLFGLGLGALVGKNWLKIKAEVKDWARNI